MQLTPSATTLLHTSDGARRPSTFKALPYPGRILGFIRYVSLCRFLSHQYPHFLPQTELSSRPSSLLFVYILLLPLSPFLFLNFNVTNSGEVIWKICLFLSPFLRFSWPVCFALPLSSPFLVLPLSLSLSPGRSAVSVTPNQFQLKTFGVTPASNGPGTSVSKQVGGCVGSFSMTQM